MASWSLPTMDGSKNMRDLITGMAMGLAISLALFGPMTLGWT